MIRIMWVMMLTEVAMVVTGDGSKGGDGVLWY